MHTELGI